jgi:proprotein convertase subtilisin/kexin type 5
LACNSSLFQVLSSNNSACAPCSAGYYENSTCLACINNCLECSFATASQVYTCTKCNVSLLLEVNSNNTACSCQKGYYDNSGVCTACVAGCLACTDGLTCNTCDSARNWQKNTTDGTCVCISSYFQVNSTSCSPCQTGCLSCSLNPTLQCTQCNTSAHFALSTGSCICDSGFQLVSSQCVPISVAVACGNGKVESG